MMKPLPSDCARFAAQRFLAVPALLACISSAALAANDIAGVVRNGSSGQLATGDEVILLRLDGGVKEEARATTDARGAFAFSVQKPAGTYLVRVIHRRVSYEQRCSAGESLSLQVYDAAPRVNGVSGSIEILRAGTNANLLHVSDMYEIRNESSPPLTQAGERTFEVYVPAKAQIDSVLAAGPEKIGTIISADAVPEEPGHYTVNFPLRPGATKFAFNYDLPYDGHAVFRTRHVYPMEQFAIMIPASMKFTSRSEAFGMLVTGRTEYRVEAANQVQAGEGPGFEISGMGELPPLREQANAPAMPGSQTRPDAIVPARPGVSVPEFAGSDSHAARNEMQVVQAQPASPMVLAVLIAVLLASSGFMLLRGRKRKSLLGANEKSTRPSKSEKRQFAGQLAQRRNRL
jgi:hypothetical protein